MEKLKMHSPDLTQENIARIQGLFPNCVTETRDKSGNLKLAVDFDQLRLELSDSIVEGPHERYHLNWPGKREALSTANAPIAKTLRPYREESVNFDTTKNIFIEGDNLEALKLLQESYLGKVKMIYIDPPYNTGNDFIYEDDFAENTEEFLRRSNQKDEKGNRLLPKPESKGRFHSNWLTMMYPRMKLARNLLRDDGVILISIDEIEHPRLRLVMDEVFGQSNFVSDMVWSGGRKNDSKLISVSHEYVICYAKNKSFIHSNKITWRQKKKGLKDIYQKYKSLTKSFGDDFTSMTSEIKKWYSELPHNHPAKSHKHYCEIDEKGVYFPSDISWPGGGGPKYEVLHPKTNKPVKIPSRGWITPDSEKMNLWIKQGRVHFGKNEQLTPCLKKYLKDSEYQSPYSVFYQDGRAASKRLRSLMESKCFEFPKDETIIQEYIEILTTDEDIILDFFAGSSTTAHAILKQNSEDGKCRKFIMVQLAELCDEKSEAYKAGYKNIVEISKERIRRAGNKIIEGDCHPIWNKDVGFRVFKLDSSNMKEVYYRPDDTTQAQLEFFTDNIKDDRTDEDLLFQVLQDWGVYENLSLPIRKETIQAKTVFFVDENALVACFDKNLTEEFVKKLTEYKPVRVAFRDTGFASDAVKINVEQIFKQMSPVTEVKAI